MSLSGHLSEKPAVVKIYAYREISGTTAAKGEMDNHYLISGSIKVKFCPGCGQKLIKKIVEPQFAKLNIPVEVWKEFRKSHCECCFQPIPKRVRAKS